MSAWLVLQALGSAVLVIYYWPHEICGGLTFRGFYSVLIGALALTCVVTDQAKIGRYQHALASVLFILLLPTGVYGVVFAIVFIAQNVAISGGALAGSLRWALPYILKDVFGISALFILPTWLAFRHSYSLWAASAEGREPS